MSEAAFKKLISGQTQGAWPLFARWTLQALSLPYGLSIASRNFAFDAGWRKSVRIDVPAISIGNLTTGGTGKTPVVAAVVRELQRQGHQPGIVSRGYGADQSGFNDEKRVLDLVCPGVPHIQNPDRVAAARRIISEHQVTSVVLDDAFQHRRIARDLNIVLIDATNPFGYDHLLPRGLLREPVRNLNRANVVLITRADAVATHRLQVIENQVRRVNDGLPIYRVVFQPTGLLQKDGRRRDLSSIAGQSVMIATAIGNPAAFVATCQSLQAQVVATRFFPDHHHYTEHDLRSIRQEASLAGATRILTTLKDMVKIPISTDDAVIAVQIETQFVNSREAQSFKDTLASCSRITTVRPLPGDS